MTIDTGLQVLRQYTGPHILIQIIDLLESAVLIIIVDSRGRVVPIILARPTIVGGVFTVVNVGVAVVPTLFRLAILVELTRICPRSSRHPLLLHVAVRNARLAHGLVMKCRVVVVVMMRVVGENGPSDQVVKACLGLRLLLLMVPVHRS